eukprot:CAMPEP_0113665212 /NCGR_PEP_ID=MMETSP0038_2-20120614/2178_1 /TAXON_ID=2898 /ORGANISM="Cryptomonas paramecium" /LENGTH=110 /DNA_ID=CAMNT_0000580537 /DNA_START=48 /DNA_END=376 /DNA_ORIENTATION=+ /assembly_acc=CAM_ASM_000170
MKQEKETREQQRRMIQAEHRADVEHRKEKYSGASMECDPEDATPTTQSETCQIQLRLPGGELVRNTFQAESTVAELQRFVSASLARQAAASTSVGIYDVESFRLILLPRT